jgi:predicted Zn-dependent peptidase
MKEELVHFHFKNDIRVVFRPVRNTKVMHCGFALDIGSRDEDWSQEGLAHFWEHMAFKGTSTRKSYHILSRLEVVGGDLNAYTTKEKIWFHASALDTHFERSLELLRDITFNSIFPEKEISKEKGVILEEMAMYQDSPEESIMDDFEQLVFGKHPLGHNILGRQDTVSNFKQKDFNNFLASRVSNDRLIFSVTGNIPTSEVETLCRKYLSDLPKAKINYKRKPFTSFKPQHLIVPKPITQAHTMLGIPAYSLHNPNRIPLFMLTHLLGGTGMTSRLNMSLRERKGLVYSVEANYTPFVDSGLFSIYFGTEKKNTEKAYELVRKEMSILRATKLGTLQLHQLKEQIKGQLAMSEENNMNFMQMMGKSMLDMGRVDSLQSLLRTIDQISASELRNVANEILAEKYFSRLDYIPS